MKQAVLITRPAEEAADTARAVQRMGLRAICLPALEIHDTDEILPGPVPYHGLIFSSANGVRAFLRRGRDRAYLEKPVFAVGENTARAARIAGFNDVRIVAGTMKELVASIKRDVAPPVMLLHLRGRDVRDNPAILLPRTQGWTVDGIALYAADVVPFIPWPRDPVAAVLFYSARSAAAFMEGLERTSPGADLSGVKALCLAQSVLESLDPARWADVRVAATPDQAGMMALLESLKPEKKMQNSPVSSDDDDALGNAPAIIERFGGIRPMAGRMDVPVTTVQGWKKRGVIPGNRRADVLAAAGRNGVDLDGLVDPLPEDAPESPATAPKTAKKDETGFLAALKDAEESGASGPRPVSSGLEDGVTHDVLLRQMKKTEIAAIRKSVLATVLLLLVLAVIGGLLATVAGQRFMRDENRLTALEAQNPESTKGAGVLGALADELRTRLGAVEESVGVLKTRVQAVTAANPALSGVMGKLQDPQQMEAAIADLKALTEKLQGRMDGMDAALDKEQEANTALGNALRGVSPQDLKAAALLIGLTQFRQALGRGAPFSSDLALLQNMTGNDDPELNAAIAKLAPYAEDGVQTPQALSNQLAGLAGDVAVASVSGQGVSIKDKALARLQGVIRVRKDGQPVGVTPAQGIVASAQGMLAGGNIAGAVSALQTLHGPAGQAVQPVIRQGQATMLAQQVQNLLSQNILARIKGAANPVPLTTQTSPLNGLGQKLMTPAGRP